MQTVEARDWNNISKGTMRAEGFEALDFLSEHNYAKVVEAMKRFEWRNIYRAALANLLLVPVDAH